jgi:UDP-N-acetylmuramoyl-tripeptide--D-alanyl-D-alanine ligase
VLGDMLELGPQGPRMHREIGEHAHARGVDVLVTVGALAAEMRAGFPGESHAAPDARAAGELLAGLLCERDTVLVKGSRGVHLELVLERLRGGSGHAAASAPRHDDPAVVTPATAEPR